MALTEPLRYTMDELLKLTVERGASYLHMAVGLPPMLRISGKLTPTEFPRLTPDDTKRLIYSILNDKQKEKFEKSWELDCSHGVRGFGRFASTSSGSAACSGHRCEPFPAPSRAAPS